MQKASSQHVIKLPRLCSSSISSSGVKGPVLQHMVHRHADNLSLQLTIWSSILLTQYCLLYWAIKWRTDWLDVWAPGLSTFVQDRGKTRLLCTSTINTMNNAQVFLHYKVVTSTHHLYRRVRICSPQNQQLSQCYTICACCYSQRRCWLTDMYWTMKLGQLRPCGEISQCK